MKPPPWKVGELATRTGVSVRALHHYDEIGLLRPTLRTPSGHRLYDRADVGRLQQIQSLRQVGFTLDEVKKSLDGDALSPRGVIKLHLARLHEQIAMSRRLAERLIALDQQLGAAGRVSIDELCRIIEEMTKMEKYFTPEQLETLRERRTGLTEERQREVRDAWNEIIPRVRAAMEQGVDPGSPEMLEIGHRWKALVDEFTGQDPAILKAVQTMYAHEGPALQEKLGEVPTPDMFAYIGKTFAAMRA